MSQKTKYVGLGAFGLFIICFVIELVSVLSGIGNVGDSGKYTADFVILLVVQIIASLAFIANSVVGMMKIVKQGDLDATFRRASDGVGGFGAYLAFIAIYTLILMSRIYGEYGMTYKVPAVAIIMLVLAIIAAGLAIVGSIKQIPLTSPIRCLLLAVASLLLFVVSIITITQGNQRALTIVEYVFLMIALVAFIVFAYFCYDDQKGNPRVSHNKSEEDFMMEENDYQAEDWEDNN